MESSWRWLRVLPALLVLAVAAGSWAVTPTPPKGANQAEASLARPVPPTSSPNHHKQNAGKKATTQPATMKSAQPGAEANLNSDFSGDTLLSEKSGKIEDPLSGWNNIWFHFNDKLYYWGSRPTSKTYAKVLPRGARQGISNFFQNLETPMRVLNCALQGQFAQSGQELERFGINTTVGVLGFGDPATKKYNLPIHLRDGDQTLAKATMEPGAYLTWPVGGPSSVRGTFGTIIDAVVDPLTYVPLFYVVKTINNQSLNPDEYDEIVRASVDPYVALREAYVQHREKISQE